MRGISTSMRVSGSRSASRSPAGSGSNSRSGSSQSKRSSSAGSQHSNSAASRRSSSSGSAHSQPADEDSRSGSPNLQIDDAQHSHSDSEQSQHSASAPRSRSATPAKNAEKVRSVSRSRSRSPSQSDSGSDIDVKQEHKPATDSAKNSATEISKQKKMRLIDSDDDEEPENVVDAQDIFGDADDISLSDNDEEKNSSPKVTRRSRSRSGSSSAHSRRSRSRSHSRSRSRSRSRSPKTQKESQGKGNEIEAIPETRIEVEIPRIVTDLGKEIHFVKLPNFLSVEMRPFDRETYEDEIDEEETMDEEGRQRIKLKVSNTIRWCEYMNNQGNMVRESNARFVRWSDGSQTLHLGNEMFDVYRQPLHGDHNHLFIRQGTGLQGQAVFRKKLTFRPHSTESFTHKKMTMSLADRSQKTSGIKILTQVGKDPTTDRRYYLKIEEEKLRQAMRSQHKPQPKKKKVDTHGGNTSMYNQDDASDDENAISLSAIKNKYKKGAQGERTSSAPDQKASAIYSSDDDEGSDVERRRKKADKTRRIALRDSDSESNAETEKNVSDNETTKATGSKSDEVASNQTADSDDN